MKVLIIAHGHPTLHKGGGEVAAYSLFQMLKANGHTCVFVGWSGKQATNQISQDDLFRLEHDNYLINGSIEYFDFSSRTMSLRSTLENLFFEHDFDVIHLHHYVHIGIDIAAMAKFIKPGVRTVLTLHEYLAICNNNGQLFTTEGVVCSGYAPERCVKCFPEKTKEDFFMRELTIKAAFSFVDVFISPSEFLKKKYCEWGIRGDKIVVVENPLPINSNIELQAPAPIGKPPQWSIGFFGQINYYKGLDILLEGIKLANDAGHRFTIGIHGKMASVGSMPDYLETVHSMIRDLDSTAVFHGPYNQEDVVQLMRGYHFVAMGSRWYENSPVVIQEAIAAGRPIIAPDHGGMVEKTQGIGLTFQPNSPLSLFNQLASLKVPHYRRLLRTVEKLQSSRATQASQDFMKVLDIYSSAPRSATISSLV